MNSNLSGRQYEQPSILPLIYFLYKITMDKESGGALKMYYFGLTLAISGFVFSAATEFWQPTGNLSWINYIGVIIPAIGLALMGFSLYKDGGDLDSTGFKAIKELFDKTTFIELLIAILGLVSGAMSVGLI